MASHRRNGDGWRANPGARHRQSTVAGGRETGCPERGRAGGFAEDTVETGCPTGCRAAWRITSALTEMLDDLAAFVQVLAAFVQVQRSPRTFGWPYEASLPPGAERCARDRDPRGHDVPRVPVDLRLARCRGLLRPERLPDHVASAGRVGLAGTISLRAFYRRRARRLLPALVVALAGFLLLNIAVEASGRASRASGTTSQAREPASSSSRT